MLSFENKILKEDLLDFNRPENMVIICTSLTVPTNHNLSYPNQRKLLWTAGGFLSSL